MTDVLIGLLVYVIVIYPSIKVAQEIRNDGTNGTEIFISLD